MIRRIGLGDFPRRVKAHLPALTARQRVVKWARWGVANTASIHYTESAARSWWLTARPPNRLPLHTDCSGFATLCYRLARLSDPNGLGYKELGYCHSPETRTLTADLRWVPVGDLQVGDELWAFDEESQAFNTGRKYRYATVLESFLSQKTCVRVCLSTGESFVCSADHPWLTFTTGKKNHTWRRAVTLANVSRRSDGRTFLVRPFAPWTAETSYEAGWLAGMFDGEGWVQRNTRNGAANGIGLTQAVGPTATRVVETAQRYGSFHVSRIERPGIRPRHDLTSNGGGRTAAASFLGRVRPERLIADFDMTGGELQTHDPIWVEAVEPVGDRDVQSIQTSSATYLAEGFAVHNTGTLLEYAQHHGQILTHLAAAKPGDLIVYGPGTGEHVAIIVEAGPDPLTVSHGRESEPAYVRVSQDGRQPQRVCQYL